MKCDKLLKKEVEMVEKIKKDELWLEGERRNHFVPEDDKMVAQKVNEIITEHVVDIEHEAAHWCLLNCEKKCDKCLLCGK